MHTAGTDIATTESPHTAATNGSHTAAARKTAGTTASARTTAATPGFGDSHRNGRRQKSDDGD
jgi:hypothetical protein